MVSGIPLEVLEPLVRVLADRLGDHAPLPAGLLTSAGLEPADEPAVLRALFLACAESLRAKLNVEDMERVANELRAAMAPVLHGSPPLMAEILETAPLGVMLTDNEGRIWDANAAALAALHAPGLGAILGIRLPELARVGRSALRTGLAETLSHGTCSKAQRRLTTCFGGDFLCEWKLAPLREGGRIAGAVAYLSNAGKHLARAHNDERRERFSMLGELIAAIAHELNNPLTGILGNAQLLKKVDCAPMIRKRIALIDNEAKRCRRMILDILSFARRYDVEREMHNVNALLSESLTTCEERLAQAEVALEINLAADLPELKMDAGGVRVMFSAIVTNACEALSSIDKHSRTLRVDSCIEHEFVRIAFRDNGPGIAKEDRRNVFDPFFTTRNSDDHPGLGLSLAYDIARQHGGHIQLTGNEGEGATFTVVLPLSS
ncbi:MAG: PAS domain-containing protein [Nitrospiraceae bacterium]|nr:PAS domain-containing protein [Nitrospiraceae bacterium]